MYGMVNDAVKSFVTKNFSHEAWLAIAKKAQAPIEFDPMTPYDDAITYQLVGAICEQAKMEASEALRVFGQYWIEYASETSYGPLIRMFGPTFTECVKNLDQMHMRMGATLPQLKAPRFVAKEISADALEVVYQSERSGLTPFVVGLIEGLAKYYGTKLSVKVASTAQKSESNSIIKEESKIIVSFIK